VRLISLPLAVRLWRMRQTESLVIRPHRSGYVFGGAFLLFTAVIWVITRALNSIRSQNDVIIWWIVFPILVLFGMSIVLGTALPKVTVDSDIVEVRDRLGRHRRFARSEVSHAAMRAIIAPTRYGWFPTNAFFLIGKDGRSLVRLPEDDYDPPTLQRLVETLGLAWPETKSASVRQIRREFPGAFPFDFQTIAIATLIILAAALAVITLAVWFR
jgi:hypothetical protein